MTDTYNIEKLHRDFSDQNTITIDELYHFYKKKEPDLNRSTIRWRIYELSQKGILHRVKRGGYKLGEGKSSWMPQMPSNLKEISANLQKKYPYLTFCIWSTQWLLDLTHHMPIKDFILIDTERETEESVFYYLQDVFNKYSVYLQPNRNEIKKYIGNEENNIVVRSLISQSPLTEMENIQIPKLEKIMVDLVADDVLFGAYQGKELKTIFENILDIYTINYSTLRRYGKRRNKWDKVKSYLEESSTKTIDT